MTRCLEVLPVSATHLWCVCLYDRISPSLSQFDFVTKKEIFELIVKAPTKSCIQDPFQCHSQRNVLQILYQQLLILWMLVFLSVQSLTQSGKQLVHHFWRSCSLTEIILSIIDQYLIFHLSQKFLRKLSCSSFRNSSLTMVFCICTSLHIGRIIALRWLCWVSLEVCWLRWMSWLSCWTSVQPSICLITQFSWRTSREFTFGVLEWFTSYVSDHYQSVVVDGVSSLPSALVPRTAGYVLGPGLFSLYTQRIYLFHLSLTGDNISLNNQ